MYQEDKKQGETITQYPELLQAAELIKKNGWIQGGFGRDDIGYCLIGSLRHGVFHLDQNISTTTRYFEVRKHLTDYFNQKFDTHPFDWNDDDNRTKEEVVAVLQEAAYWVE